MPRSSQSATIAFPPFAGAVRTLVLANVGVFFAIALLQAFAPRAAIALLALAELQPAMVVHGAIWQLVTYSFVHTGILEILFAMLTLWFCGSMLEGAYGARWLRELYFSSAIGGALLAAAIALTGILHLSPDDIGHGAWAGVFGLLVAIALRMGDTEFLLFFVVRIRAKYMVAIYILFYTAVLLKGGDRFGALLQLAGGLAGALYLRFAPRGGLAVGVSERLFGVRNAYYRYKRRRAARKFQVYMGKQGRSVKFDSDGRYIDPDKKKDPTDKRWMN